MAPFLVLPNEKVYFAFPLSILALKTLFFVKGNKNDHPNELHKLFLKRIYKLVKHRKIKYIFNEEKNMKNVVFVY